MTDKSNDKIMPEECQHTTYHHPKWHDDGTCNWDDLKLQPKAFNAQAKCVMPPTKIIPVIFITGCYGE